MLRRFPRLTASLVTLAWILAQGHPVATAYHVAEDHAHAAHDHGATGAGTVTLGHAHSSHDDGHVHGLPDGVAGIRAQLRGADVAAVTVPEVACRSTDADGRRIVIASRAPDPPPPRAPSILLL